MTISIGHNGGPEFEGLDELRATIEAARMVPLPPGSGRNGSGPLDLPLAMLARNDIGNAERFRKRVGDDFLLLQEGGWLVWDGKRWDRVRGQIEAEKAAQSIAIAIREEANALENAGPEFEAAAQLPGEKTGDYVARLEKMHGERVDALRRHATNSGNSGKLSGMLKEAGPHLWIARDAVDADPWRFNCPNATLHLVPPVLGGLEDHEWPWEIRRHERGDRITHLSGADYPAALFGDLLPGDAGPRAHFDREACAARVKAAAPVFFKFLERVQPAADMRDYLQRLAGYLLTGDTGEQELFLNVGKGANGKGTLFEALAHTIGSYAAVLPIDTIKHQENRNGSQARPEIARLPGARFVRISEADENERLSEGVVKKITGQDRIEVRDLFKGMFEFAPQFKLVLYVNDKPAIRGTDDGIWRRIRLIEWPVQIPKAERDRGLAEALKHEAAAILAWALLGFAEWRKRGLDAPASVLQATEDYRIERDPLVRYVEDCLLPKPGNKLSAGDLYELYELWCSVNAVSPLSPTGFGRKLPGRSVVNMAGETATIEKAKSGTIQYSNIDLVFQIRETLQAQRAQMRARTPAVGGGGDPGPQSADDYGAAP